MKKILTVLLALIVVGFIGFGVLTWLGGRDTVDTPPPDAQPTGPVQPDWCPDVEVIAAPGTWESSAVDDPVNPTANPNALLLNVTRPLQDQYPADKVKVWTLPYTAQFKNAGSMDEMSYDDSRNEGITRLDEELKKTHGDCPLTDFIMIGFSQGAIIVGDTANQIGTGIGAVDAERVRGVALVADGRREAGVGQSVGTPVPGVGAEISLKPLNAAVQLVMPGATMRGPRPGGFGALDDRTVEICAPGDHICAAPIDVTDALERARNLIDHNGVHAQYAGNMAVFGTETTPEWLVRWTNNLINQAPAEPAAPPAGTDPAAGSGTVTSVPPIPQG
ncbi:cutinase family protein [Corynebacterium mendelii]|uniref:Cutinase family protein n=1 Tax=Corynebacterium mendelii TaxID=2765362 RepID=A0A939E1I5_9CORY|nr:cutinase family protein [Corynebacterium mendelii]MBN9645265.1 cutinase family protein [Corynebacterium mendelii]